MRVIKIKQIKNLKELKNESESGADFYILLNGYMRSSKWIQWYEEEKIFFIRNEIDDSEQELTEKQIMDKEYTNIGVAIKKGGFYKY